MGTKFCLKTSLSSVVPHFKYVQRGNEAKATIMAAFGIVAETLCRGQEINLLLRREEHMC